MRLVEEPMLDGMPEPPPAWQRPDRGVRMSALTLDRMLQAALPHAGVDEVEMPVLCSVHLSLTVGLLTTAATDRFTMIRERQPVSQTCDDFGFLLRSADASCLRVLLKQVLRGLKDADRDNKPVDLALEQTDDGPTLRVLGQDLDVRFTEQDGDYPRYEQLLDNILEQLDSRTAAPFDVALNPTLLARVVPLQKARDGSIGFLFRSAVTRGKSGRQPVVVRTSQDDDDVVIAIMPINVTSAT